MTNRIQKVEELMESFQSIKRSIAFKSIEAAPRITPSQWGALMFIERQGKSTVKEMARSLGITSSAATQLVDGLVASGYVLRTIQTKDRRATMLTLSNKTEAQINRVKKDISKKFLRFFKVLNDKEFDQYIRLNKKITGNIIDKKI